MSGRISDGGERERNGIGFGSTIWNLCIVLNYVELDWVAFYTPLLLLYIYTLDIHTSQYIYAEDRYECCHRFSALVLDDDKTDTILTPQLHNDIHTRTTPRTSPLDALPPPTFFIGSNPPFPPSKHLLSHKPLLSLPENKSIKPTTTPPFPERPSVSTHLKPTSRVKLTLKSPKMIQRFHSLSFPLPPAITTRTTRPRILWLTHPSSCRCILLLVRLFVCLFVCLFACSFVCLFVCLFACSL